MTRLTIKSTKTSAVFIAAVLVVAIFAVGVLALNSSTITSAQAQMYDNQYGKDNYYKDDNRYSYDNNQPKSPYVDIQKINCENDNTNINGIDITKIPRDDVATNELQGTEGGDATNTQNGNGLADRINFDRNLVNICVNVNDNEQVKVAPPPSTLPPTGDEDGDLLLNSWETNGIDSNSDGNIDLILANANPLHKDIYIEADFMQFHQPNPQAINDVINSFANAPLSNPDGINGINLHVDVDEEIPHQDNIPGSDMVTIRNTNLGTAGERADANSANILSAKRSVYHYAIFAHGYDGGSSSGLSNGIPAMEFIVTLGVGWTQDATGHSVGSQDEQSGTFMHELGHNIGLQHGGSDSINCKPNYLSVMQYNRQMSNPIGDRPLDYSRNAIPSLDETNLSESDGIGQSEPPDLLTVHGPSPHLIVAAGNPVDWNRDTDTSDAGVNADINFAFQCGASPNEILNSFDDWDNIVYITNPAPGAGLSPFSTNQLNTLQETPEKELTSDQVQQSRIQLVDDIEQAIITALGELPEELEAEIQQVRDLVEERNFAEAIVELDDLENKFNAYSEEPTVTQNSNESREQVILQIENMKLVLQKVLPPSPN